MNTKNQQVVLSGHLSGFGINTTQCNLSEDSSNMNFINTK